MLCPCLDSLEHVATRQNNEETLKRQGRISSTQSSPNRRNTSSKPPWFISVAAATAAAAAIYTVLVVNAFSTKAPCHHRIRPYTISIGKDWNVRLLPSCDSAASVNFFGGWKLPSNAATSTKLFQSSRSSGKVSDQTEWKAVFMSLQLYKAAYGDLKVPVLFVVPSMAPWPEAAWGMKLGKKVGAIRESGLYIGNNEKRRQQLENLGFVWRMRAPKNSAVDAPDFTTPFDQIFDALLVYRSEIKPSGPLSVPTEFTVPDAEPWPENTRGLPLGRSLEQLRSKKYLDQYPGAREQLVQIGFDTDEKMAANDKRFKAVYLALERYKEIYGDMLVPQPFVVPSDSPDWPEESWGLRLGARVNAIRSQGTFVKNNEERREMLDTIGFVWTPPEKESKRKQGRKTLSEIDAEERQALIEAANSAGVAPTGSDAFEDDVESFLSSFDFSSDGNEDDESVDESSVAPRTWGLEPDRALEDLSSAPSRETHERQTQQEYVAPKTLGESLAAARVRALESGVIEDIKSKRAVKRKREPDIPWFNDDFGGDFVFEDVVEALTLYKQFYGDFSNLTTVDFVIPVTGEPEFSFDDDDDDIDIDDEDAMNKVANELSRFDEIDNASMTEDQFEAEILKLEQEMLASEYEEKTEIATLAPAITVEWPEHLEGMRLGDIVKRIREGSLEVKHLPERKSQLDVIGFDWGNPLHFIDIPFEKAMCAMYAYYMVRGDLFVPPEFVMPDEDPWPAALAGYELGKIVKRIRELQNFFEAFHTEKLGLLRMVDFVWFPTLALPIDPDEKEMSPEMMVVGALGHPDYAFLESFQELPFGLADKIISEGPFYEKSDDPRKWWREYHNWDYVEDLWYSVGTRDRAVQLRRGGFPRLADEHEAKYGPGLFQEVDDYLNDLVDKIGSDGFIRILGDEDAKTLTIQLEYIQNLKERYAVYTATLSEADSLSLRADIARNQLDSRVSGIYGEPFHRLFSRLDGEFFRGSKLADPMLEEAKQTLYGYYDELKDSIDFTYDELEMLWLNRIQWLLCAVQAEVFKLYATQQDESKTQKGRSTTKGKRGRKSKKSGSVEEDEYEEEDFGDDVEYAEEHDGEEELEVKGDEDGI